MHLLRKAGSPYWYAGFESPRGSNKYVSKSTKVKATPRNRREALEVARDLQDSLDREYAEQAKGGGTSVLMVIDRYWSSEASKLNSSNSYFRYLERIADHLGDERNYCNVGTPDVAGLSESMAEQGLGNASVNKMLSVWQRMHRVAATKIGLPVRVIDWAICRRLEPAGRTRFIEMDEARALLRSLPDRGKDIFIFGLMTGCRKEQILSLSWDQVSMPDRRVWVIKKNKRANVRHWIECNPQAMLVLEKRENKGDSGELVFDTTNFRRDWDAARDLAGVKDFTFHDIRHTAATWLARTSPLHVVKEMLGHADISTTMRYSHVTQSDVRAAVDKMPSLSIEVACETNKEIDEQNACRAATCTQVE